MSELVGNAEDRFSHNEAHITSNKILSKKLFMLTRACNLVPLVTILYLVKLGIKAVYITILISAQNTFCRNLLDCLTKAVL